MAARACAPVEKSDCDLHFWSPKNKVRSSEDVVINQKHCETTLIVQKHLVDVTITFPTPYCQRVHTQLYISVNWWLQNSLFPNMHAWKMKSDSGLLRKWIRFRQIWVHLTEHKVAFSCAPEGPMYECNWMQLSCGNSFGSWADRAAPWQSKPQVSTCCEAAQN